MTAKKLARRAPGAPVVTRSARRAPVAESSDAKAKTPGAVRRRGAGRFHPTRRVTYRGVSASIDTEIAPLILAMWKAKIPTWASCQDAGAMQPDASPSRAGWAMVGIVGADEARWFLDLVARDEGGDGRQLYNRITREGCRGVRCWEYEVCPFDAAFDPAGDPSAPARTSCCDFIFNIFFPASDFGVLVERLNESCAAVPVFDEPVHGPEREGSRSPNSAQRSRQQ